MFCFLRCRPLIHYQQPATRAVSCRSGAPRPIKNVKLYILHHHWDRIIQSGLKSKTMYSTLKCPFFLLILKESETFSWAPESLTCPAVPGPLNGEAGLGVTRQRNADRMLQKSTHQAQCGASATCNQACNNSSLGLGAQDPESASV